MLLDILLVFVFFAYLYRGWRRGFKYSFVRFLVTLASSLLAGLLARPLSETVVLHLNRRDTMASVEKSATEMLRWFFSVDGGEPQALLKNILYAQEDMRHLIIAAPGDLGPEAQQIALELLSRRLFTFIAYVIAFFIIYAVIRLVLLFFIRVLTGAFEKLPGGKFFQRLFGLFTGVFNYFLLLNFLLFFGVALMGIYPAIGRMMDRSIILGLLWELPYIKRLFTGI